MKPMIAGGAPRWASCRAMVGDRMPSAVSRQTTPASTCVTGRTACNMGALQDRYPLSQPAHPMAMGRRRRWLCDHRCLAAFIEAVGDDQALDLAGAFPDAVDAQFAIEALGH